MSPVTSILVTAFIRVILGTGLFNRIDAAVARWAEKEVAGADKRHGVMAELELIGVKSAEWAIRMAIELAVGKMNNFDKSVK